MISCVFFTCDCCILPFSPFWTNQTYVRQTTFSSWSFETHASLSLRLRFARASPRHVRARGTVRRHVRLDELRHDWTNEPSLARVWRPRRPGWRWGSSGWELGDGTSSSLFFGMLMFRRFLCSYLMFACLFVFICFYLFVCLFVCLFLCLFVCFLVCVALIFLFVF